MTMALLSILGGFILLTYGADWLVKGSASLALRLQISSLVIGLTVVAYGTSMPEMIVSTQTAWHGQGDISIGNVVGSNIFNIAFILGIAALICPMNAHVKMIKIDTPIMVVVTLIFLALFRDMHLSRLEGAFFIAGALVYTVGNYIGAKKTGLPEDEVEFKPEGLPSMLHEIGYILIGLVLLVIGSRVLVDGSVFVAKWAGVSEAVIGLTIIAGGTSLPELATSVTAAIKKEPDIALGNVVGSNIFNILGILGLSAVISPLQGTNISWTDMGVMTLAAVLLVPMLYTGKRLSRAEGAVLLALYVGYIVWLLQNPGAAPVAPAAPAI